MWRGGHGLTPALMTNDGSGAKLRRRKTPSKHNDARVLFSDSSGDIKAGSRDKSIHFNWVSCRTRLIFPM